MSNIILYHTHTPIPDHVIHCIKKIREYSNIPIYFLTDQPVASTENIIVIDIKKYEMLNWLNSYNYFLQDDHAHLWKSSCFRLFYIKEFMEEYNIENALHFDNDVLLYENPEFIIEQLIKLNYNFGITAHNNTEVVFGMSFIKTADALNNVVNDIKQEFELPYNILKTKYQGYPTEMRLISALSKYETIPILPNNISVERYSNNYTEFNSVFDPSSYGQYLGGIYRQCIPGWYNASQEIGIHIGNNNIKVFIENKIPYIDCQDKKIKINNLHIHSKQLEKFI
jgi:hypothetical protein